ncbi:MAG: hypothetical protein ACD_7C00043G0001 [uncultured bacterium]|nr:MAG: hypothetical protein ACD_7C00043G0001 [uncultured bacterium]KKP68244.1 MAG: hypothetical protein UR66_C0007G0051 [Candidatus Moranbacteria bacterium GW2011_GWE1_35_17]KKP71803.1 MAG: hypothetical protein UR65_C0026G0014 [Candidatus Moranbacteria bacterium GW2011_GWE2_35_164]KKP82848.1 MAG: hypothetical protein UR82_C0029G0002 [Candidatus Moranbacteria bacterium GW2011_GWF1_35_5]KKP84526.1 MAG: hypothetical protein UR83_C0019G0019 [Candidatus Moranbacteria bacterium GW2011_GWF2_35_54]
MTKNEEVQRWIETFAPNERQGIEDACVLFGDIDPRELQSAPENHSMEVAIFMPEATSMESRI